MIRERKWVRGIDSGFIEILSEIDEIESKSISVFANPLFLRESTIFFANPLWINNLFCEFTIHSRLHFGFTIFFTFHYGFTIYFANPLWIHDLFREFTLSFISESNVLVLNSLRTNSFYRKYTLQNDNVITMLVIMTHTLYGAYCWMLLGEITLFSNYHSLTELEVIVLHFFGSFSVKSNDFICRLLPIWVILRIMSWWRYDYVIVESRCFHCVIDESLILVPKSKNWCLDI